MKIPRRVRTNLSLEEYKKTLTQAGYRRIGSGLYADVFAKKGSQKRVIKVGAMYQDGYLDYLRLIIPSNPFFPKVYNIQCFSLKDKENPWRSDSYYVVEMERLTNFRKVPATDRHRIFDRIGIDDTDDFEEHNIRQLHSELRERKIKNPNLFQTIRTLKKLYQRSNSDIHEGNVMWRTKKKGMPQLVITDPVV